MLPRTGEVTPERAGDGWYRLVCTAPRSSSCGAGSPSGRRSACAAGRVHCAAQLGQLQADQVDRRDPRDERLRRRDAIEAGRGRGRRRRRASPGRRGRRRPRAPAPAARRASPQACRRSHCTGIPITEVVGTDHEIATAVPMRCRSRRGRCHLRSRSDRRARRDDVPHATITIRRQAASWLSLMLMSSRSTVSSWASCSARSSCDRVGSLANLFEHGHRVAGLAGEPCSRTPTISTSPGLPPSNCGTRHRRGAP